MAYHFAHEHDIKPQPQRIAYVCSPGGQSIFLANVNFISSRCDK